MLSNVKKAWPRHSQNRPCRAFRCFAANFCSLSGAQSICFLDRPYVQARRRMIVTEKFNRAIRRIALTGLFAALQLTSAHYTALTSCLFPCPSFHASMEVTCEKAWPRHSQNRPCRAFRCFAASFCSLSGAQSICFLDRPYVQARRPLLQTDIELF